MKKKISAILCIAMLFSYVIPVKAEDTTVILDISDYNAMVNEPISYQLLECKNGVLQNVADYTVSTDSDQLTIDKNTSSVYAKKAGIYELTFKSGNFQKKICIAVSTNDQEWVKGAPVFSEDFEGDVEDCFENLEQASVKQDEDQNHYLYMDARGKIINTDLFADEESDYVFEADIQTLGCDASSTSQMSVGMRAMNDLRAYRFAYHDVIKYPGNGHTAGTGTVIKNAFSMSRSTTSPLLSAWYYAFVKNGYDDMYDEQKRGQIKPYHWEVSMVEEKMNAKISDSDTDSVIADFSANTTEMDGSNAPLVSGKTTLSLHSIAARFDNIKVSPLVLIDGVSLEVEKECLSGNENDNKLSYSVKTYMNDVSSEADRGMYEINCPDAIVDPDTKTITFPKKGDYYVSVNCGEKNFVRHIEVSEDAAFLNQASVILPETVYGDFLLEQPENVSVIYVSSDTEVIEITTDKAVVIRPKQDQSDCIVMITAVIYRNDKAIIKRFPITVKKETSAEEALEFAQNSVVIPRKTNQNLKLPTAFSNGVECVWTSSDNSIIATDGTVMPAMENMRVRLTADFSFDDTKKRAVYDVIVLGETQKNNISVMVSSDKTDYEVGEVIPIRIRVVDNLGIVDDLGDVVLESNDPNITIDSEKLSVSASAPGIYSVRVRLLDYEVEKEICFAVNNPLMPEVMDYEEVYSENFDSDDYDEAFKSNSNLSVSDGKLIMKGKGQNYQTAPFGPKDENGKLISLQEYVFDADIKMSSCDAGNTGQMSVGMRYDEDEDASYRVSHHERIRYDEASGAINTASATLCQQVLSVAYGKSYAATSWYFPNIEQSPAGMFSGRGYSKEYHWQVLMMNSALVARITDPDNGATVQEMSCTLENLTQKKDGGKLTPISYGSTVLGAWSTDLEVDNIKLSTIKSFEKLEIDLERDFCGQPGESIGFNIYSISGDNKTLIEPGKIQVSSNSPDLLIENGYIKATASGEYYIKAELGTKYAVAKFTVSEEEEKLQKAISQLSLPVSEAYKDFQLPTELDGVEVLWSSSDEETLLPQNGTARVFRPEIGAENRKVTLTAVLQCGTTVSTVNFELTVYAQVSDLQAISDAKKLLSLPETTKADLELTTSIGDNVAITWTSSDKTLITDKGKVYCPAQSKRVVLTAVLKRGAQSETVRFVLTVLGTNSGNTGGSNSGGGGDNSGGSHERKTPLIEAQISGEGLRNTIFIDLDNYAWAQDAIYSLYDRKIVLGYGEKLFMPGRRVTREEFVTMLCRSLDIYGNAEACFSDVDASDWYAPYISAASHQGIVSGFSDGSFGIGKYISRQDMAVMLASAMKYQTGEAESFADNNEISDYAKQAVYQLKSAGIVVGSNGYFYPRSELSRAEAATVIYRAIN